MMFEPHRLAEHLMGEGDRALAAGNEATARERYREAAEAEALAFAGMDADHPRTRAVVGISSVVLFRRAGERDRAARQGYRLLAEPGLPDASVLELEMILDELRTERWAGLYPHADGLQWALRGGRVGFGVARLETVSAKIDQIQRFAWRVFEHLAGRDLRTTLPAPADVREAVDLLVSQPVAGSFAFSVRLSDYQLKIENLDPGPSDVTDAFESIIQAAQDEDPLTLEALVPDQGYRDVFLRMVRNIAPDGREIGEIEVRRIGSAEPPTVLTPAIRAQIRRRLPRGSSSSLGQPEAELRDVLRVIDLNRRKIALGPADREQPCVVPEDLALVDLIEGLEDRPVRVKGHWQGRSFVVHDIESDYGDET